jgi:cytochrome c oxidase subunit 1
VGSWLLVLGLLMFFGTLLYAILKGEKAEANPWGGVTLEWTIASPPPLENFDEIPTITHGPYHFEPEVK